MKKIIKRKRNFRINNPLAFGILCAMILIFLAGVTYARAAGVIAPAVRSYRLAGATPTPTPTVAPVTATPSPSETPVAIEGEATPAPSAGTEPGATPGPSEAPEGALAGHVIGIDPARGYSSKVKGVTSGVYANRLNYTVATLVKDQLNAMGATVIMGLDDVKSDKDSAARAAVMNSADVELALRLECNYVNTADTRGAIVWVPSAHALQEDCDSLGSAVLKSYVAATGLTIAQYNGESIRHKSDETFFNDTEAPVCTLIMGYISNSAEDKQLNTIDFQKTMAEGIVKGILNYMGVQ